MSEVPAEDAAHGGEHGSDAACNGFVMNQYGRIAQRDGKTSLQNS
jgi:hypothetical protein